MCKEDYRAIRGLVTRAANRPLAPDGAESHHRGRKNQKLRTRERRSGTAYAIHRHLESPPSSVAYQVPLTGLVCGILVFVKEEQNHKGQR